MPGGCGYCGTVANRKCGRCGIAFYCNREHQKLHWFVHKTECKTLLSSSAAFVEEKPKYDVPPINIFHGGVNQSKYSQPPFCVPNDWQKGLSGKQMYEWLMDCYRMRVDDTLVYQNRFIGLYNPSMTKFSLTIHFWAFCKLCIQHEVVIVDSHAWNWKEFLAVALCLISKPFMKSNAVAKYGQENVFLVPNGTRSLRNSGDYVYSCGVTKVVQDNPLLGLINLPNEPIDRYTQILEAKAKKFATEARENDFWKEDHFQEVGGQKIWKLFHEELELVPFVVVPLNQRQSTFSTVVCPTRM